MAANDHLGPMPAGRALWAPRAKATDRKSEGRAALLTIPGCPEVPRVRRKERLAIAPAGHHGAVLLRCEVGGGGSGRRHAPIPEAAASPFRDVAARATHAMCPKPPPGRSRSPTARCTPAAMIDVAAWSRSPARKRQRDRDLGEFPRRGAVVARRLHRALYGCDVPPHGAEVEGPGLHAALHRLEVIVCRLRTPATVSVASMGSPKRAPRVTSAQPGNALPGDVDVIRRGAG